MPSNAWWLGRAKTLLTGAVVTAVKLDTDPELDEPWWQIEFQTAAHGRVLLTLSSDDEGNAPGSAFIEADGEQPAPIDCLPRLWKL
jgi:hypothetical protein